MAIAVIPNRNIENSQIPPIETNPVHHPIVIRIIGAAFKRTIFNIYRFKYFIDYHNYNRYNKKVHRITEHFSILYIWGP